MIVESQGTSYAVHIKSNQYEPEFLRSSRNCDRSVRAAIQPREVRQCARVNREHPVRKSGDLPPSLSLATGKEDTMPAEQKTKSLTFSVEQKGDAALVHCRGQLVAGVGSEFAAHIRKLIPDHKKIVLDLTDLTKVDSMGLGTLVTLYTSAKRGGSCIELINLGKQVRELLGITHLLSLFGDMCEKGVAMKM